MFTSTSQVLNTFTYLLFHLIYLASHILFIASQGARHTLASRRPDRLSIKPRDIGIKEDSNNCFVTVSFSIRDVDVLQPVEPAYDVDLLVEIRYKSFTKKRDWASYNLAQRKEMDFFEILLADLVKTVAEPEQSLGRKRTPLSEQIFCAVLKSYSQLSSRRVQAWIQRAKDNGHISFAPHYNVVSKTLLNEAMTPILRELIRQSALPLAELENDFAIDSSGFSCSSFSAYRGSRHGVERQHEWVKAHICSGVKTNIVTDVIVTGAHGADAPQFKELVINTAEGFLISEVSADKAYLSRDNLQLVGDIGAIPYIPFRKGTTSRAGRSEMWHRMFYYFQLHRAEFDDHYHKRSNVESTFGAIKMKFGEHLKSKNFIAQKNELLCKILAYNITVLIYEMITTGVIPEF